MAKTPQNNQNNQPTGNMTFNQNVTPNQGVTR